MASKVEICNRALIEVTGQEITSLTDNTLSARLCDTLFNGLVDELSLEGEWSSTIKRQTLVKTGTTPNHEWMFEYQLPTNPFSLKVLTIDESQVGDNPYAIEGDKLLTNATAIKIRYIARITDTQSFSTGFTSALVAMLAWKLSRSFQASTTDRQVLRQEYEAIRDRGLSADGQQGSQRRLIASALHDVR